MKKTQPDYYAVLGIQRDAKPGAIKQAYRELVRKYHPDAAGSSAQARAQFEQLQEAYEILSDPSKRGEYDAKLPPRKYPAAELDAESLWREATQLIFERSDSFSNLIQTMRIAAAIALEGDLLVVGIAGKDQYLAGHLAIPGNRYRINQTLREISGREIEYRVIEGTEKEDWEFVKRAEGHRTVPEAPATEVAPQPAGARQAAKAEDEPRLRAAPQVTAWELLGRKIHNTWNGTPNRQHPLTRAEYLLTCVHWISETSKEAMEEGAAADSVRREVGKAIERVAQLLDIPPTMVALELMRGQHRRRAG
jgi:curved DNA-binding protein CbpA